MAGTKIFVSSTCYDLSVLRAELRNFILSLGHEPVMSDYADIAGSEAMTGKINA